MYEFSSVQFSLPVTSNYLQRQGLQHARPPWPTHVQSLLKLMSIKSVMPSSHLVLCRSLFHLQSFLASGSFQIYQFFTSGGKSIGVSTSASVLPVNIQDWFPLGWTDWISLQSKGLSKILSNTTVQKYHFFSTQLYLYANSHIHTWRL